MKITINSFFPNLFLATSRAIELKVAMIVAINSLSLRCRLITN